MALKRWIEDSVRDVGFALRLRQRSPGFTAVGVLSLALGIGANTAVLDVLALRTLPVHEPDRLVFVDNHIGNITVSEFERLRGLSTVFTSASAVWTIDRFNLTLTRDDGTLDRTIAGAAALLTAIAALAAFVPARRASRVDPMTALRCE